MYDPMIEDLATVTVEELPECVAVEAEDYCRPRREPCTLPDFVHYMMGHRWYKSGCQGPAFVSAVRRVQKMWPGFSTRPLNRRPTDLPF